MFIQINVTCSCRCEYNLRENIQAESISCPNCKLKHPFSDKLIQILKTANEIPDGSMFEREDSPSKGIQTKVVEEKF